MGQLFVTGYADSKFGTIPHTSLKWILIANFLAILPHFPHLPIWLFVFSMLCLIYRILIFKRMVRFFGRFISVLLVLLAGLGIFLEYRGNFGVAAGIALLVMSFSMKLLEMKDRRDAYTQVILGYFVLATEFLFDTSWLVCLYLSVVMVMITAALVGLNQSQVEPRSRETFNVAFKLSWQALPMMLFLFIFFPRMDPFWAIDVSDTQNSAGLRESMEPGDFNKLGQLNTLAFRAEFNGVIPHHSLLYWRGMVFSDFDGVRWSVNSQDKQFNSSPARFPPHDIVYDGSSLQYRVLMEPSGQNHLFALDMPRERLSDVTMTRSFSLMRNAPINQPYGYEVETYLSYKAQLELPLAERVIDLALPEEVNPKTRALVKDWMDDVANDQQAFLAKVLGWFREDNFVYTLSPKKVGDNTIDNFLFDTKEGYCAYYASAFVFMMRSAGIPARVVAGYMGGDVNPLGDYVLVKQYAAHAWAEVWLPDQGWVRVDPTSAVAPERIRDSIEDLLEKEGDTADTRLIALNYPSSRILRKLQHSFDYVSFRWRKWVVGYDRATQEEFFSRLFPGISTAVVALVAMSVFGCIVVVLAWVLFNMAPKVTSRPMDVAYLKFCGLLKRWRIERNAGEPPVTFYHRARALRPECESTLGAVTDLYMQQYGPQFDAVHQEKRLAKEIKRLARELKKVKK